MKIVQKLALVDPHCLELLQNKQLSTVLSNLDIEMQQILRQFSDEEKIALYQQILQKYTDRTKIKVVFRGVMFKFNCSTSNSEGNHKLDSIYSTFIHLFK